jgi:hypothetical protein
MIRVGELDPEVGQASPSPPIPKEGTVIPCYLCRFSVERDDVALSLASGFCICLRCFGRETGSDRPMPMALRREVDAVLAQCEMRTAATTAETQ